jgi:hypothetical protein
MKASRLSGDCVGAAMRSAESRMFGIMGRIDGVGRQKVAD